ncbi:ABC transporter permease [uncultured Nevskia sp.]|uniref:ABC transporter permease n=1 Tax=uncultured Nevskia sp. TaxID=228950 RepID=UPI0025F0BDDF|nr:ABC transporter permease [uncultured Nevskia sp.]
MSLALIILRHDWRRFLPALLSVSFAGVLMLVQLGLLAGMFGTVTVLADTMAADLWLTAPAVRSIDQAADIPANLAALLYSHPAVVGSETLMLRDASWRGSSGTPVPVTLVGISPDPAALSCPQALRASLCGALAEPDSVVVDASEADKLEVPDDGNTATTVEINGHRLHVVGVSNGLRSIGTTYVFLSRQSLRSLLVDETAADTSSFVLAGLRPGSLATTVVTELEALLPAGSAKAWTRDELSGQSQRWWLAESGVGAGFLFSTVLGLLIAVVITSQTLRSVVLGQLREYAAFRAIGVPPSKLGAVIVEQSAWIGAAGGLLMLVVVAAVSVMAARFQVPFALQAGGIAAAFAIGLLTAIGSGLLALRELYRLQPAELLR